EDEEAIITAAGFPGVAEHAAIHRELVDNAVNLVGRFHAETLDLGELFQFLAHDVVARHMLGSDREFFSYLNRKLH
ncbi:MAG: diguanylate cyclase, partial [Betaproteobacteria bacterium]